MISKKTGFIVALILICLLIGIPVILVHCKKPMQQAVVVTGLTEGQQKTFQQDLSGAMSQYGHIKKGDRFFSEGRVDDALKEYHMALSLARSKGSKGEAYDRLANVYEKKRDYVRAKEYVELDKKEYVSDWATGPLINRIKYLEYASIGEYELAKQYGEMAIEADRNQLNSNGKPSSGYIDRLNDLIASKDYILSLRKINKK